MRPPQGALPVGLPAALPVDLPSDWPHRSASRRIDVGAQRWHVQVFGAPGPQADVVLLHGAGASAHSWRDIAPALAGAGRVIVPDLPGHGWTGRPIAAQGLSLPGMSALTGDLLRVLGVQRPVLVGHSAGAAVAARMALDGQAEAALVIGLNGAWLPPAGQGRWFYEPLARVLALNPLVPHLVAWSARRRSPVERLVASTGSRLDARGLELYARLVQRSGHVAAVMAMMAAWDLRPLLRDLPRLSAPLHLLVADGDLTVPPQASAAARRCLPQAGWQTLHGLGHLAHEEAPTVVLESLRVLLGGLAPRSASDPAS
jgi:magnesium chelatase accessory protein